MSKQLVQEHADLAESLKYEHEVWSLRLDDATPEQRRWLIDHHGKVMRELRRRGHQVRAAMDTDEHGFSCISLRVVRPPTTRHPDSAVDFLMPR